MEDKKLNIDAPFLSVRRTPTKPHHPNETENTKKKKTTATSRRRKVKDSFQETEHETLTQLLLDHSFDHVMAPSSVPFKWEQTIGKPEDTKKKKTRRRKVKDSSEHETLVRLLHEQRYIHLLEPSSVPFKWKDTPGNGDKSSNISRDDVILEYRDLIMSKFLPAAEVFAMKNKKEASRFIEERKKKQSIALQRVSMAINQDLNNDEDDDEDVAVQSKNNSKKAQLPWFCSKNSVDVLNPVLSRIKTCQDIGVRSEDIINPKPDVLLRIPRTHLRLQGKIDQRQRQEIRVVVEEVKRRSNRNKNRAQKLSVSQPPVPKTPSDSWLCRTVPRSSTASVVSGQADHFKTKMHQQKTNSQSINWETIVKTSYKHHDHARNSEELRSRQHKS